MGNQQISGLLLGVVLAGASPVLAQSPVPQNGAAAAGAIPAGNAVDSPADPQAATEVPAASANESLPGSEAAPAPAWSGTVELYGFAPLRTTGTTTVRGFTADLDLSLAETLPLLQWATQLRASVEQERVGVLADLSVVRLGKQVAATSPRGLFTGRAEVTALQGLYDIALRYRFGEREAAVGRPGQTTVIPYAGIRLVQVDLGLSAQIDGPGGRRLFEREGNLARTWVQPLVGTQASVFLSPRLRAFARADIAGFGLDGPQDLSGNAQLGLGYALGNSTDLNVSWRYFGIAFDNGAERANGFTSYQNGVEIGLKLFF